MSDVRLVIFSLIFLIVSPTVFGNEKRLVLHSQDDLISIINELQKEVKGLKTTLNTTVQALEAKISTLETTKQLSSGSDVYIRWGRTSCPSNGTEFVYKGYMAGNHYNADGGGSNNLCLPEDPTWNKYVDGINTATTIYGTEIELDSSVSMALFGKQAYNQDLPCSVCRTKASSVMLPARAQCYPGWDIEYSGYLISAGSTWKGKVDYVCLDSDFDFVPHGGGNDDTRVVQPVEVKCGLSGGLPCPPYVEGRELACVVCSK